MESYISLGRTTILLALCAQKSEGNILYCTKREQNKTKIGQWRLLKKDLKAMENIEKKEKMG